MLEKDKNCIEFSMRSMIATHKPYQEDTEISITGMAPGKSLLSAKIPFDSPCDVVVVSKSYFEKLQTENEQLKKKLQVPDPFAEYKELFEKLHSKEDIEKFEWTLNHICGGQASVNGWMVTAKSWKRNYETLSKLVGFSSTEEIQDYLTNDAECDTLQEAISKLKDQVKYTCDEWYSANSRNNSWKAAAECNSPKELIETIKGFREEIEMHYRIYKEWKEATGCPSPSAAKSLIEFGASWHHAYRDVKKANEKLADEIKSWQKETGYLRPEDISTSSLISKAAKLEEENAGLFAELREWKHMTKCETPEAAATWITSYESACGRGNRLAEMVEKLKEEVVSWKNVTGYSTPESYLAARLNNATPFDYTAAWQAVTGCSCPKELSKKIVEWEKVLTPHRSARDLCSAMSNAIEAYKSSIVKWLDATGCDTPEQAKERIKALNESIDESEADYNHLLCTTGFESEGEIEDALDKCDHSTLRKALVDYKFDYEALLKLTGYKTEQDIRVLLNDSEQFVYETMRELISSLKNNAKFTESNWQHATGCDTPGRAEEKFEFYKERLGKVVQAASCAAKHLENITC